MSQWTHVNASIRYDGIAEFGNIINQGELGKMCKWEDEDTSHWDSSIVPCGSEGSLEYEIVHTGGEGSIACRVVVITGDLRSYNDVEEILAYFKRITKGKMIRSGVLEIDVEGDEPRIYRYTDDGDWVQL